MVLFQNVFAVILLITLTIWLQCAGIAALVALARRAMTRDIHKLRPFRVAVLVVRFTTALILLQGLEILLWASYYRWICLPSWDSALFYSACSYSTVGFDDVRLPPEWRLLGPMESITGVLMAGISVSVLFAIVTRLVGPSTAPQIHRDEQEPAAVLPAR